MNIYPKSKITFAELAKFMRENKDNDKPLFYHPCNYDFVKVDYLIDEERQLWETKFIGDRVEAVVFMAQHSFKQGKVRVIDLQDDEKASLLKKLLVAQGVM